MARLMVKGKAVESDPYIALRLIDGSGKWVPGTPRVVSFLASVLEKSIQRHEKLLQGSKKKDVITIFHCSKAPSLSIRRYLQRMNAYLTSLNAHRLLITSLMVAAKFLDDQCYNNAYYAKVGGVSTEEMNGLEIKFLFSLDFRLHITTEVFKKYCLKIEREGYVDYQPDQQIQGYQLGCRPRKDETKTGPQFAGQRGRAL